MVVEAVVAAGAGVVQEAESNKLKSKLMYRNFKQLIPPPLTLSCSTFITGHEGSNNVPYPHEDMRERNIG